MVGAKELFDGVVEQAEVRGVLVPLHLSNGRYCAKLAKNIKNIVSTSSICRSNFVVNILSRSNAALRSFTCTIGKVFVVSKSTLAKKWTIKQSSHLLAIEKFLNDARSNVGCSSNATRGNSLSEEKLNSESFLHNNFC